MSSITIRHDLRGRFGPARDQGGRETCLAFAMSDAHAAARGNPWAALCCEYLFYHAKQRDGTPARRGHDDIRDPGSTGARRAAGRERLAVPGSAAGRPRQVDSPDHDRDDLPSSYSKPNGTAFDEVWDAVEADQPVLVVKRLSMAFTHPDTDGVVDADDPDIPSVLHAVLAVATAKRGRKSSCSCEIAGATLGGCWGTRG